MLFFDCFIKLFPSFERILNSVNVYNLLTLILPLLVGMVKNFEVDPYTGIIRFGVDMPAPTTYFIDLYATDFAGNKLATGVVVEIEVTKVL